MKNNLYLLFSFVVFITILFSKENKILWDFGVVINTQNQKNTIKYEPNVKALISNPFIPPIAKSIENEFIHPQIISNSIDKKNSNDINGIKLAAAKLTVKSMYLIVIEMINKVNFSKVVDI